jgi:hypothetical protein
LWCGGGGVVVVGSGVVGSRLWCGDSGLWWWFVVEFELHVTYQQMLSCAPISKLSCTKIIAIGRVRFGYDPRIYSRVLIRLGRVTNTFDYLDTAFINLSSSPCQTTGDLNLFKILKLKLNSLKTSSGRITESRCQAGRNRSCRTHLKE